ncbi:hypothetical protein DFH07DRAFT_765756 [Mycena maculata]|uniref:RING-type domain-containing protein n=1 Tax=Mycena maculata TaxID=230809 RepID=A0AAD7NXU9_9AGAR|nr:hypothetical protein DFH07DRAFT_765756 [Mycena maculata]
MSSGRRDLNTPNYSIRHAPLVHDSSISDSDSDVELDPAPLRVHAPPALFSPRASPLARQDTVIIPFDDDARASLDPRIAVPRRAFRVPPKRREDLWLGGWGPPAVDNVVDDHTCNICMCLKSHPVSYMCGHGHCYACIRLWLEYDRRCPECRTPMACKPFRVFAEEKSIARAHGNWDTSRVDYNWDGLVFPSLR